MLTYLHANNKHPRSNHLGDMNQKPKKEIFTLSHPCMEVKQHTDTDSSRSYSWTYEKNMFSST